MFSVLSIASGGLVRCLTVASHCFPHTQRGLESRSYDQLFIFGFEAPTPYGCRLLAADWVFTIGCFRSFDDPLAVLPKVS